MVRARRHSSNWRTMPALRGGGGLVIASIVVGLLNACGGVAPANEAEGRFLVAIDSEGDYVDSALAGSTLSTTVHIVLEVSKKVAEVRFHLDGAHDPMKIDTEAPFDVEIDTTLLEDGLHTIIARTPAGRGGSTRVLAEAEFFVENTPLAPLPPTEPPPAQPVTAIFVAPWGSDGAAGTYEAPLGSLLGAAAVVRPGGTIFLRGGVYDRLGVNSYYQGSRRVTIYGTADAPVTIKSYPGEEAIIDGGRHPWHPRSFNDGHEVDTEVLLEFVGDHTIWEDLTLRGSVGVGLFVSGNHNVFRRIRTHQHHAHGVYLQGSYNLLEYVVAHDNDSVSNGGNSANGIVLVDGGFIRYTHGADAETRGNVIRFTLVYRNSDDGIGVWNSWDTTIEHSVAFENGFGSSGNGIGFKLGGGGTVDAGTVARFNVAFKNIINYDTNGSTGVLLYNNTSWAGTDAGFILTQHATNADQNTAHNNLSYGDRYARIIGTRTVHTHNSWNLAITNPRFVTLDATSTDFLTLAPDSPALDAGIDLGFSDGTAPDLGALQQGETVPQLAAEFP
jgi:hypothetical protein